MFNRFVYKFANFLRAHGYKTGEGEDPRVQEMQSVINRLGGINFKIDFQASGEWVAESTNLDGIITGGKKYPADVTDAIRDAVFTYFEIPPQLCNDTMITQRGEAVQVAERVYV